MFLIPINLDLLRSYAVSLVPIDMFLLFKQLSIICNRIITLVFRMIKEIPIDSKNAQFAALADALFSEIGRCCRDLFLKAKQNPRLLQVIYFRLPNFKTPNYSLLHFLPLKSHKSIVIG